VINFLPTPADWAKDAACTQSDPDAWFPSTGEGNARAAKEATRICRDVCPVREECLASVLALDELPRYGIWAGFSVAQLRQLKAPIRKTGRPAHRPVGPRAACGTYAGYAAHQRHKDAICTPCRQARTDYQRERRAAKDVA
jgi:hypothetical protein